LQEYKKKQSIGNANVSTLEIDEDTAAHSLMLANEAKDEEIATNSILIHHPVRVMTVRDNDLKKKGKRTTFGLSSWFTS
jgi:hypothetical protein